MGLPFKAFLFSANGTEGKCKKTEAQGNKNVANKDSQYLVTYSVDVYKTNKAGRRGRRGRRGGG